MPETGWARLGRYVVAGREEQGHKRREDFANALGISLRTVGDIEKGRRDNYDQVTLAAIERVLGWETGSAIRIVQGGEPTPRSSSFTSSTPTRPANDLDIEVGGTTQDPAIVRVMRSNLDEDKKRRLVRMLIAEREAADRSRLQRAEELIRFVEGDV